MVTSHQTREAAMKLDYASPKTRQPINVKSIVDWTIFGIAVAFFASTPLLLAAPGGFVSTYLTAVVLALYPN
jgi:hypothetical protein